MSKTPEVKVPLYKHQIEAYEAVIKLFESTDPNEFHSCGAALFMEMGTGKTLTSIAVIARLYMDGKINRALIVCPKSIMSVWEEEFEKFADFPYDIKLLTGTKANREKLLRSFKSGCLKVAVINYEYVRLFEPQLTAWNPGIIVADESHKIKSPTTAVSKKMHSLGSKAKYKLALTGTPITNKAIDIFSQYKFLNPNIFGTKFYTFRNKYFDMTGYGNYTPVLKRSMAAELAEKMQLISYRVTKSECLDLPETVDIIHKVKLEPEAQKKYRELTKQSFVELGNGEVTATNMLTKLLRLSQFTGGFLTEDESTVLHSVSEAKLDALFDIVDSAQAENKKLVVIAHFNPELDEICKRLEEHDIKYAVVRGGVKNVHEMISSFQEDPECTVFVGQIAAAGLGITLTAADTMVFYSMDYSTSNYQQCRARIHRNGQKNCCSYIHLIAENTIDSRVLKAIRDKEELGRMLCDEYRNGMNPFEGGENNNYGR